jgi:sodium transport system permease protein
VNLSVIRTVAAKELLDLLRDRRTILSMVVIPVLAIPLLITGISWFSLRSMQSLEEQGARVAVIGAEQGGERLEALRTGERYEFEPAPAGRSVDSLLARDGFRVVLEFDPRLPEALARLDRPALGDESPPEVLLHYDSTDDAAKVVGRRLSERLSELRAAEVQDWIAGRGLHPALLQPWTLRHVETATAKKQAAELLARFLPYVILILCLQGAMYPAMDLTAGEKERSTIETLLVNPVSRLDLILGKYVATAAMALGTAVFTLGGQYAYFAWAADTLAKGAISLHIDPLAALVGLLLLLPVALLFAALLLAISLYARSLKEAQSYLGPLMMVVIFPAMVSLIPGMGLSWKMAFAPVFNVTLLMKAALMQDFSQPALMIAVFFINLGYAALALWAALGMFNREQVIFRS